MHKIVHKHEPEYLYELLPDTINDDVQYDLRNKKTIREFLCSAEKYKKLIHSKNHKGVEQSTRGF